jgi:hypothetical protein
MTPDRHATWADVALRILSSRYLAGALLLIVVFFIVAVAMGFIGVSWGSSGISLSQGQRAVSPRDFNIEGTWRGEGKDLQDSDHKLIAKYTYTLSTLNFKQHGSNVEMAGTYTINEDKSLPPRTISGHGVIRGDYLYMMYDIQAGQPPIANTHGTMLFQISPSSHAATGYFLTRSMANDGVVFGALNLTR